MMNLWTTESKVIQQWQAKVSADIDRWEKIRKKEVPSGYEGTHGEDTGIEHVWDREVKKLLSLKPSAVVSKEEVVSLQEALGAARGGVSQLDINDLWRSWTQNYSELVRLSTQATKEYSAMELRQIYGVTEPVKSE